ncbi:MAG: hypothetical protein A2W98_02225 [Bacteroidetes bacterium GWF2_33_38]|nr:MAG: hypothetical protein A2W98_02225 [Bacteroidetes bacterium GWF2_33_38]HBX51650.1 hypothetical protein [Bacteroidales bacterium]
MSEKRNIEDFISDSFETFEVQPSEMLKTRIDRKMFFVNLIHFHKTKIALVVCLICFILFGIFYFPSNENALKNAELIESNNQNNFSIAFNENANPSKNSNISNHKNLITESQTENNSNIQKEIEHNNTLQTKTISNQESINNELDKVKTANQIPVKNDKSEEASVIKSEQNIDKSDSDSKKGNLSINENANSENYLNNIPNPSTNLGPSIIINKDITAKDLSNQHNEEINDESQLYSSNANNVGTNELNTIFETPKLSNSEETLSIENNYSQIYKMNKLSGLIQNTELKNINYYLTGTMIDTSFIQEFIKKQKSWFVDFYWTSLTTITSYKTENEEFKTLAEQKNDAFSNTISYNSFGFRGGFSKNRMLFQAGLDLINISENYNYELILNNPHDNLDLIFNNNPYDFEQDGQYYDIDTIGGYYHYTYVQDSIIYVGDSSWVDITELNLVNMYDSVLTTVYDSLKNKSYLNKYSYFEIPFTVGYKFQFGNIDITSGGGIATGILFKKSGSNISEDLQNNEVSIENLPFRKISLTGIIYMNINYNITEKISLFIEPTYRYSIISSYKSDAILQRKSNAIMLKIGARIKF